MVTLKLEKNMLSIYDFDHYHVVPKKYTRITNTALSFNKIIPDHPFRLALEEKKVLCKLYGKIKKNVKENKCLKAVLVGHNAWFDLSFLVEANKRNKITNMPLHQFTSFDTATLGALVYGQTVLSQILNAAHIKFNDEKAHSALYDAIKTAQLFCKVINQFSK